jgi:hypothetical protein
VAEFGRIFRWKGPDGSDRSELMLSKSEKLDAAEDIYRRAQVELEVVGRVDLTEVAKRVAAVFRAPTDFSRE